MSEITFVERDAETILAGILADFTALTGITLQPADARRFYLQVVAETQSQIRALVELSARRNLIQFADGVYLDALGELYDEPRLDPEPSTTTLRYTLSGVLGVDKVIPAGTRSTAADSGLFWFTAVPITISAGDTQGDVAATCTTTGVATNGFIAGQIDTIVDPIADVDTVENLTETTGGADTELDPAYRIRLQEAPNKLTTAGPVGSYVYLTKQVSAAIINVSVTSPDAGDVLVVFLLTDGAIPGAPLIAEVDTALSGDTVRPLTDNVTVEAPTEVEYAIALTWYIAQSKSGEETAIRAAVEGVGVPGDADYVEGAIREWIRWNRSELGRDVNPSQLIADIMGAAGKRVALVSPSHTVITDVQIGVVDGDGTTNVTYGGLEAD